MLLEFKRKSDALQLIKILGSIEPDMEINQLAEVFGIEEKDIKKIFSKKPCFDELTPAERLATDGECVVEKLDYSWAVEFPYVFPGDGGEQEESLLKILESICRKLKLKVKRPPKRRRKSDYLRQCEMMALQPANFRQRSRMIWVICRNYENCYNLEHSDEILRVFDKEIEETVITDENMDYIRDAVESLKTLYKDNDITQFERYSNLLSKVKRYRGDENPLPKSDTLQRFQLAFSSTSSIEIKAIIHTLENNFGFIANDYTAYMLGDQADGHERMTSDAQLARAIRFLPENESITARWRTSSPASFNAFIQSLDNISQQCRPDVALHTRISEIVVNHKGIHFHFWTTDMSDHPEFTQLVLDMLPTKMLAEALHKGAGLTPAITLLETNKL